MTKAIRRSLLSWHNRLKLFGVVIALPALLLFAAFAVYPMLRIFYLSLFDYSLISESQWVGLQNFQSLFSSSLFHNVAGNTVVYTVGTYVPAILLALALALAVNERTRTAGALRVIYFVPVALSWVVVAIIWRLIYHPEGLMNQITGLDLTWLTSTEYAQPALIIMSVWKEGGFFLIIFLAGLQSIDQELYSAASVDGAGFWARFRYVTLPLLKPVMGVACVFAVIRGMQAFAPQYVMTGGGPANATEVINLYVYKTAFGNAQMGLASAAAVLLFITLMVVTLVLLRLFREN